MQEQLLEIKELLPVWYLIALENKIFIAALVVAVWICFSLLYGIKSFSLKKKIKLAELQKNQIQEKLTSAEQKIKACAVNLATAEEQMEEEQQASAEFKKNVAERHQQVVEKIREVAQTFDLSEQLVGASESISDTIIWQQQDNMLMQLTEHLSAEKNASSRMEETHKEEIARLVAESSSAGLVKEGMDELSEKLSQLTLAGEEQKTREENEKSELQQQLLSTLERNQAEIIALIGTVSQTPIINESNEESVTVEPIKTAEIIEEVVEEEIIEPPVTVEEVVVAPITAPVDIETEKEKVEPVTMAAPPAPAPAFIATPFSETLESNITAPKLDIPTPTEAISIPEPVMAAPAARIVTDEALTAPAVDQPKVDPVKESANAKKGKKLFGLGKSLFSGKGKKSTKNTPPVATKSENTTKVEPENTASTVVDKEQEAYKLKKSDYGKSIDFKGAFKGLLGKKKK